MKLHRVEAKRVSRNDDSIFVDAFNSKEQLDRYVDIWSEGQVKQTTTEYQRFKDIDSSRGVPDLYVRYLGYTDVQPEDRWLYVE